MTATEAAAEEPQPRPSTRQRLVDAAAEAFVHEGYSNVSVRQLAKRTDMTSGAIYGNFANKGDLLMEVIDARIRTQLEVLPNPGTEHLADVLRDIFAAHERRAEMRALLVEGAAAARGDAGLRNRLRDAQATSVASWTAAYRDLQAHGELAEDLDAGEVVTMLWAMEVGLGLLEAIGLDLPEGERAGEIVRRMVAALGADDEGN